MIPLPTSETSRNASASQKTAVSLVLIHIFTKLGKPHTELSSVKKTFSQSKSTWAQHQSECRSFWASVRGAVGISRFFYQSNLCNLVVNSLLANCRASSFKLLLLEISNRLILPMPNQMPEPPPIYFTQFPRTPTPFLPLDFLSLSKFLSDLIHGR